MNRRKCDKANCGRLVWSGGLCKMHDALANPSKYRIRRTGKPREGLTSKKKPIARYSKKGRDRKDKEAAAMREHWNDNADHAGGCSCRECGKYLKAFSATYVHHVLPKGRYIELQANKKFFVILCAEHHEQIERGDAKGMKIYEHVEKLKRAYLTTKNETNG